MLAYISVIRSVILESVGFGLEVDLRGGNRSKEAVGDSGSTWTMSSHVWTIDLIREVLPTSGIR